MIGHRWVSHQAQQIVARTGILDPGAAITHLAMELLEETGINEPPFSPHILASFRGARVAERPIRSAARLFQENGSLVIEVNQDHSPGKRNFSVDHEVSHTLLPTYFRQPIDDEITGQFSVSSEEELLCDIGAAALLLPSNALRPRARDGGPSLQTLVDLAELFQASLQATARNLAELDLWPCAYVLWEEGYRKEERPLLGQPMLPIFEPLGKPLAKYRVSAVYASQSFPYHVPFNKSVENESLVVACCSGGEPTSGMHLFDLGRRAVELYCENVYAPYRSDGMVRPRIVSLLSLPRGTMLPSSLPQTLPLETL